jgi:hypothetical protein
MRTEIHENKKTKADTHRHTPFPFALFCDHHHDFHDPMPGRPDIFLFPTPLRRLFCTIIVPIAALFKAHYITPFFVSTFPRFIQPLQSIQAS